MSKRTKKLSEKRKFLFRLRRAARQAAYLRLAGYISGAQIHDHKIERYYAVAKRSGWSEDPFVRAEEQGRHEGQRRFDRESTRGKAYYPGRHRSAMRDPRRGKRKNKPQKRCRSSVVTQSVVFDKKRWKANRARRWLAKHKFKSGKADVTKASLRYRQLPPSYVKVVGGKEVKKGVRLILGCPKRGGKKHKTSRDYHERGPHNWGENRLLRQAQRALRITRYKDNYPTHLTAEGVLPDGRAVRLLAGRSVRQGAKWKSSKHRIQVLCDRCNQWIPVGRIHQHVGTKACYVARGRSRTTRDFRSDGPFRIEIHYKRGGKRTLPRVYTNRALADRVARRWMGRLERFPNVKRVEVVTLRRK